MTRSMSRGRRRGAGWGESRCERVVSMRSARRKNQARREKSSRSGDLRCSIATVKLRLHSLQTQQLTVHCDATPFLCLMWSGFCIVQKYNN